MGIVGKKKKTSQPTGLHQNGTFQLSDEERKLGQGEHMHTALTSQDTLPENVKSSPNLISREASDPTREQRRNEKKFHREYDARGMRP